MYFVERNLFRCPASFSANGMNSVLRIPANGMNSVLRIPANGMNSVLRIPANGMNSVLRISANGMNSVLRIAANGMNSVLRISANGMNSVLRRLPAGDGGRVRCWSGGRAAARAAGHGGRCIDGGLLMATYREVKNAADAAALAGAYDLLHGVTLVKASSDATTYVKGARVTTTSPAARSPFITRQFRPLHWDRGPSIQLRPSRRRPSRPQLFHPGPGSYEQLVSAQAVAAYEGSAGGPGPQFRWRRPRLRSQVSPK